VDERQERERDGLICAGEDCTLMFETIIAYLSQYECAWETYATHIAYRRASFRKGPCGVCVLKEASRCTHNVSRIIFGAEKYRASSGLSIFRFSYS
jgi:hypothetical protein